MTGLLYLKSFTAACDCVVLRLVLLGLSGLFSPISFLDFFSFRRYLDRYAEPAEFYGHKALFWIKLETAGQILSGGGVIVIARVVISDDLLDTG